MLFKNGDDSTKFLPPPQQKKEGSSNK